MFYLFFQNQMLRKECRHLKHVAYVKKADQSTQTVEEQSVVSCAIVSKKYLTLINRALECVEKLFCFFGA